MPTTGPETRIIRRRADYRGSKKRIDRLSAFDELPIDFWLVMIIALVMFGLCAALLYNALTT